MFKNQIAKELINSALKFPKNNAFCLNEKYFTYIQFIQRVAAISKFLENIKDNNIAIISNDDIDTYAAIFAIWYTGKFYVPINPDVPAERNKNVIDQVGIKTILDSNETVKLISQDFDVSVKLLESYLTKSDFDDQLAYILFTSGSTGIPKGVMITKSNVAHYVEAFWNMG